MPSVAVRTQPDPGTSKGVPCLEADEAQRTRPAQSEWILPLILGAAFCFSHIHQGDLAVDAIRYAAIAARVLDSGDPFRLFDVYAGERYANKPPLLFWLTASSLHLFGFSTLSAKLPAVMFTFCATILLWRIAYGLGGARAAFLALIFFCINRTFSRDLVELGFDGIAVLGMLCALKGALDYVSAKGRNAPSAAAWLGFGFLLLLQAKPPYIIFVAAPFAAALLFEGLLGRALRQPSLWIATLIPLLLFGIWHTVSGADHFMTALDNQLVEPIRKENGFLANSVLWLKSLLVSFAPFSLVAIGCLLWGLKKPGRTALFAGLADPRMRLLAAWVLPLVPVVVLVSCRPRYALPQMTAAMLIVSAFLGHRLRHVSFRWPRRIALGISAATLLLLPLLDVKLHRENEIVRTLDSHPDLLSSDVRICIDGDRDYRSPRMARYTEVLLRLHFEGNHRVYNSQEIASAPAQDRPILAEKRCRKNLASQGLGVVEKEYGTGTFLLVPPDADIASSRARIFHAVSKGDLES